MMAELIENNQMFNTILDTQESFDVSFNGTIVGPVGPGVPSGGSNGQFLTKISDDNYATGWSDLPIITQKYCHNISINNSYFCQIINSTPTKITKGDFVNYLSTTFIPLSGSQHNQIALGIHKDENNTIEIQVYDLTTQQVENWNLTLGNNFIDTVT